MEILLLELVIWLTVVIVIMTFTATILFIRNHKRK